MIHFRRISHYDKKQIGDFYREIFGHFRIFTQLKAYPYILIKPNLLTVSINQDYVTTNPAVIAALIDVLREQYSGRIVIGDGAAANYLDMKKVFNAAGYKAIADEYNIELLSFNTGDNMSVNGIRLNAILKDKPFVFNMAKLKTHMLTRMTMSVKNVYGLIPAKFKLLYHSQHPDAMSFSEFVTRVFNAVNPQMNIVDGIFGMDRNGPSNGRPVKPGIIAMSDNGYALDHFLCDFTGSDISQIHYLKHAVYKGYYSGQYETDPVSTDTFPYELPETNRFEGILKFARNRVIKRISTAYPRIRTNICKKCMNCYNICPAGAIIVKDGFPYVRDRKCLACYCCVEACPYDCIGTTESVMERITHV